MIERKSKRKIFTTIQLLCIVGIVLLAFIFAWFVYIVLDVKYANYVIRTGETRIAVVDGYTTRGNHDDLYIPTYTYVDENGVEYHGGLSWGWEDSEREVSQHYGKKVKIVIDGKGYCVNADYKIQSLAGYIIATVVFGLIIVALIILFALETAKRIKKVSRYRDLFRKQKIPRQ